jgi:diguanylate cyclase (GGDEF)-like protein
MSFSRQLVIVMFLVVLCALSVRSLVTVHEMRGYLSAQLRSHARDSARSLGLSVSLHMAEGDTLFVESIVDSMFDSGDYTTIRVDDLEGKVLLIRERATHPSHVPAWFVKALPVDSPTSGAELTNGWQRVGTVLVRSSPVYAYAQLWDTMVLSLQTAVAFLAITLVLFGFLMKAMLRPLKLIESQARAVAQRQFPRIERLPRTREFREVAEAMNFMTASVQTFINDQAEHARRLQRDAYEDPVTGLRNRAATALDIRQLTRDARHRGGGGLMFIGVGGLDAINRSSGYEAGDAFMRAVGECLTRQLEGHEARLGRYGGAVFSVVLDDLSSDDAMQCARGIIEAISGLRDHGYEAASVNVGVVAHSGADEADTLVEKCESALRNAEQQDGDVVHLWRPSETVDTGDLADEADWERRLKQVIENSDVVLEAQPVKLAGDGAVMHLEVLARFREADGELVPAGRFMPVAARLGLGASLDIVIIEQVLDLLTARFQSSERLAVNLSGAAVRDMDFRRWLRTRLSREPQARRERLCFEVTEHFATSDRADLESLIENVRPLGVSVGVDHCGAGDVTLTALRGLQLDYVKIYGAFIHGLHEDRERETLVRSLVSIAHGMGLKMVAEFVESEAEMATVTEIGFDAMQGYHLGRPAAL